MPLYNVFYTREQAKVCEIFLLSICEILEFCLYIALEKWTFCISSSFSYTIEAKTSLIFCLSVRLSVTLKSGCFFIFIEKQVQSTNRLQSNFFVWSIHAEIVISYKISFKAVILFACHRGALIPINFCCCSINSWCYFELRYVLCR